ncbi:hypothetical protein ACLOJK_017697 [Asimina triloba]
MAAMGSGPPSSRVYPASAVSDHDHPSPAPSPSPGTITRSRSGRKGRSSNSKGYYSSSSSSPPVSSLRGFNDPETKRKRRVAGYKAYALEGKVRASFRKGFEWIKLKCAQMVRGC